jgi:endogenous inhibitor of DNA gyrase (YacG/DUF329 family)
MNCPTCGQPIKDKTRKEIFEDNCRLRDLDRWIEGRCGTYEDWLRQRETDREIEEEAFEIASRTERD